MSDTSDEASSAEVVQLPAIASPRFVATADVFSDPYAFEHAQRVAKVFASSNLVPPHLKGQVADCLIAYQIARRLNEEPLTVFQNIYVVSGRPGWKTEYVIARANRAGVFKGRITWKTANDDPNAGLAVTAMAVLADSGEAIEATCDMRMARAENWIKNPKYTSMPEHMLRWRSAAMLIRLYAPEVMLGMPIVEELETMPAPRDITPAGARSLADKLDILASSDAPSMAPNDTDQPDSTASAESEAHSESAAPSQADAGKAGPATSEQQTGSGPDRAGPATNSAASTQPTESPSAGSVASGQAASNPSNPPKGAQGKGAADGPKSDASNMTAPKNEAEYIRYSDAWREALTDADEGEARWKQEKDLRNKAHVGSDAREAQQEKLAKKCREIRDADRS
ncbi:hypothetical protein H8A95_37680 [Bradyrhizobium sp. Pear76]|uniref:hypothetical protein n=1 Tax=Bradyrhizobium oropedii TaxID=1571201 RepID=UPI001E478181|nr:hypothetical protein [Bradyrhizobium oropedii]MCC8967891.1 hypothetical protein [Bradyrhizobium oropedii]